MEASNLFRSHSLGGLTYHLEFIFGMGLASSIQALTVGGQSFMKIVSLS